MDLIKGRLLMCGQAALRNGIPHVRGCTEGRLCSPVW